MRTPPSPAPALVFSQGRPVGTRLFLALVWLLLFFHGIRLLHQRLPIVPALACGLVGYILLSHLLLKTAADLPFWPAALAASALALALYFLRSPRTEPDHREPTPARGHRAGQGHLQETEQEGGNEENRRPDQQESNRVAAPDLPGRQSK